ncbi:hypothetical protein CJ739_615 [Mariniflexile rhizosphaerae]|uniref:hypothetical protein n=1 Tax=unclassified Mariniflexile TaxID=2643887 RepID=UPI000E3329DB|nr:hypothetical protein [Mariniflexile sp. TRM1-10]AXP79712.1 hypothetical protein CJ739_615 [Mariniflexile sp. TRM1-10]
MNLTVNEILNHHWVSIDLTFDTLNDCKTTVPRQPGLYSISTNTPKETLRQFGHRNDIMHYNLMNKVNASDLIPSKFTINQNGNELYCVYNGHHSNLRQRLSEHFSGSRGTGCLALFELERLREFNWTFKYLVLSNINNYVDSKVYRTFLEQHLRVETGWPILCGQ